MPSIDRLNAAKEAELKDYPGRSFRRLSGACEQGRVMAYAEGYLMVRLRNGIPYVVYWRQFERDYHLLKNPS